MSTLSLDDGASTASAASVHRAAAVDGASPHSSDASSGSASPMADAQHRQLAEAAAAAATGSGADSARLSSFVFGRADPARHKPPTHPQFLEALRGLPFDAFLPPVNPAVAVHRQKLPVITITDAQNSSDSPSSGSYIAYTVRTEIPTFGINWEAHRRYTDFENLRKLLSRLHPTCVVPPIPEKHSVADYAAKAGKAKKDPKIIDKRKRMLQIFLNRLAVHPFFREESVFHAFLEGTKTWAEILSGSGLANYLWTKDSSITSLTNQTSGIKGKERGELKDPIPEFTMQEELTNQFLNQFGLILKIHNSILKHNSEVCAISSDLGASYNGWSLMEDGLDKALEFVGQALETMVGITGYLSQSLEVSFGDIVSEYYQFERVVDKLLRWRHRKQSEFEIIVDTLKAKELALAKLESAENEMQRHNEILNRGAAMIANNGVSNDDATRDGGYPPQSKSTADNSEAVGNMNHGKSSTSDTDPSDPFPRRKRAASYSGASGPTVRPPTGVAGVFGNSGDTIRSVLSSLMDTDSASMRRNNISKTRIRILTLQKQQQVVAVELETANREIREALETYQRDKLRDMRYMVLTFAMCYRDYHRKSLKIWRDVKADVDRIAP